MLWVYILIYNFIRKYKRISTESLTELAECVSKNNIFEYNLSFYKQLRGTAVGTKMSPPYAINYLSDLEASSLVAVYRRHFYVIDLYIKPTDTH